MKCGFCLREPKGSKDKHSWDVDDVCPECQNTPADRRMGQLLEEYIEAKRSAIEMGKRVECYLKENEEGLHKILKKGK